MTAPTALPGGRLRAALLDRRSPGLRAFAERGEDEGFEAAAALVTLRDDLGRASSDVNNRALRAALKVPGLPHEARRLILLALRVEEIEDAAVGSARLSRDYAHCHVKAINGAVELALDGRVRNRPRSRPTAADQPGLEGL